MRRVYIIRHGKTLGNKEGYYQGRKNLLTEEGKEQCRLLARFFKVFKEAYPPPSVIYSSSDTRALQTACILSYEIFGDDRRPVISMPELHEMRHGEWENTPHKKVPELYPELYRLWMEDPIKVKFPGGESTIEARQRTIMAWRKLLRETDDDIIVIGHVVTNTFILADVQCTENLRTIRQDNACLNVIEEENCKLKVVLLNSTLHLTAPLIQILSQAQ
ncbi:histidine phosphatase family protein [Candidatus Giovannonibacteria bacterium]|nr:histidine phosphatase family protein [Candidatus Giovannonibacteria bacterium]